MKTADLIKRMIVLALGAPVTGADIYANLINWTGFELFSPVLWITVMIGVVIAVIGLMGNRASARQLPKIYGRIAVNTLLLIWILELAILVLVNTSTANIRPPQANLPYYTDEAKQRLWEETQATIGVNYEPFITWRRTPYSGEFVNVEENGLRVTLGAQCGTENVYTVFVFGGSTIGGTGSPDDQTIPAYLQRRISDQLEIPVCVVNHGECAYVSTQEVITLFLELQTGDVPDLVIFYDGANDVYAAYQTVYIANMFNETEDFTWIDLFHITPEGNEIIANRMLEQIEGLLPQ